MRFGGELRTRFEDTSGINYRPDSEDSVALTRIRLDLTVHPVGWFRLYVQGQDVRGFLTDKRPIPTSYQHTAHLRLLYAELGNPESTRVSVRVGRQEIVYGEQRMVGYNGWRNTGQAFDAVRLRFRSGRAWLDVFTAGAIAVQPGWISSRIPGQNLHGIYASWETPRRNLTVEPYLLWRLTPRLATELGALGNLDQKTAGVRIAGTLSPALSYASETALQFGRLGTGELHAWGGHWQLDYRTRVTRFQPVAIAEYNYASGDTHPRDGDRGTFDPPYPSVHDRHGLADQLGWRNVHHLRGGVNWTLARRWKAVTNLHSFSLASASDALYATNGTSVARSASGTAGVDIGRELDASALWSPRAGIEAGAGFAHIFPGGFLRQTTPGAALNFGYVYFDVKF